MAAAADLLELSVDDEVTTVPGASHFPFCGGPAEPLGVIAGFIGFAGIAAGVVELQAGAEVVGVTNERFTGTYAEYALARANIIVATRGISHPFILDQAKWRRSSVLRCELHDK
ncbi:MAG: hypothetical protein ACREQW_17545 [Candidatus Binatia bacterium]